MVIKQSKFFSTHINRLMLNQSNGKNLSTKETIVVSQDYPKILGSPVTCGSKRVKYDCIIIGTTLKNFFFEFYFQLALEYSCTP